MRGISKFKMALQAIEEAAERARQYQERYAIIELEGQFGVCSFDDLEPYDQIIEICSPIKVTKSAEETAPSRVRYFED